MRVAFAQMCATPSSTLCPISPILSGASRTTGRPRVLPAERLDFLPSDSEAARASRRDLEVFNALLGAPDWIAGEVRAHLRPTERVLELGAGDGMLASCMIGAGVAWDALDRIPAPPGWRGCWIQTDALQFEPTPAHRVVVANLFLHHLTDEQLVQLGGRLARQVRVLIVADLVRSRLRETLFSLLCAAMNAHPVSRHDGRLSIRAGFRGDELPSLLGLAEPAWSFRVSHTAAGAFRLVAVRNE